MRYDAVLFDLDGTLLDSVELILASYRHVLASEGLPSRTDAEILSGLGTPLEAQFRRWVDDAAEVRRLVDAYIAHNLAIHDHYVRAYPGVTEVVRGLHQRGAALAIVTSKRRRGTRMGLAALELSDCFDVLVCADDVERPKPDAEPVTMALTHLGVQPSRAVFVGDATHDIESGHAAGVETVAVTWGAAAREALVASQPHHVVDSAEALGALLTGARPE